MISQILNACIIANPHLLQTKNKLSIYLFRDQPSVNDAAQTEIQNNEMIKLDSTRLLKHPFWYLIIAQI